MRYWYEDDDIAILFDHRPQVAVRVILPSMTTFEKNSVKRFPFVNKRELTVELIDKDKKCPVNDKIYMFTVPKGYQWDGASIPKIFWRLIGSKTDSAFLIPSLIHDVLCENHDYVNNDRYFADKVFERLLYVSGVSDFKRWLMFHSVELFQRFQKWD